MYGNAAIIITGSSFTNSKTSGGVSAITVLAGKLIEVWRSDLLISESATVIPCHVVRDHQYDVRWLVGFTSAWINRQAREEQHRENHRQDGFLGYEWRESFRHILVFL